MGFEKPTAFQSILAGGTAGGLEAFITYPTEYIKTRQQLSPTPTSPSSILSKALRSDGLKSIYTGSSILCLSNTLKSAVRFATFDAVRNHLPRDSSGKTSAYNTMLAGLAAGIAEGSTVVTPGENLKTKLIDARHSSGSGLSTRDAVRYVLRTQGVRGLYRGVFPVTAKQSANAVVRFTSYGFLLDMYSNLLSNPSDLQPGSRSGNVNPAMAVALAGATSGIITVYATMPFDSIKTRMQALGGGEMYSGSVDCLRQIIRREGTRGLWRGTTPRLVRLGISSTLSFSIYEQVVKLTRRPERDVEVGGRGMDM